MLIPHWLWSSFVGDWLVCSSYSKIQTITSPILSPPPLTKSCCILATLQPSMGSLVYTPQWDPSMLSLRYSCLCCIVGCVGLHGFKPAHSSSIDALCDWNILPAYVGLHQTCQVSACISSSARRMTMFLTSLFWSGNPPVFKDTTLNVSHGLASHWSPHGLSSMLTCPLTLPLVPTLMGGRSLPGWLHCWDDLKVPADADRLPSLHRPPCFRSQWSFVLFSCVPDWSGAFPDRDGWSMSSSCAPEYQFW